ncbi:MAG: hypothetical protein A2X04_10080 [Bacteroidetes bacterium GWF2_41_9]|nr:MAG: hypothetical protein A2X04_10080 [Bacteroidetes bacterium GWF2_41_9]
MNRNIISSDNKGIIIASTKRIQTSPVFTESPLPVNFTISDNDIIITDPELSKKVKYLPLRNNSDSKVVKNKNRDWMRWSMIMIFKNIL